MGGDIDGNDQTTSDTASLFNNETGMLNESVTVTVLIVDVTDDAFKSA